jgi:hypothetical protein
MKIVCDKCEYIIDKDIHDIDGNLIEEYKNVFGTICPNCKIKIEPFQKSSFEEQREIKMERLREQMRDKLRKNIKGEN